MTLSTAQLQCVPLVELVAGCVLAIFGQPLLGLRETISRGWGAGGVDVGVEVPLDGIDRKHGFYGLLAAVEDAGIAYMLLVDSSILGLGNLEPGFGHGAPAQGLLLPLLAGEQGKLIWVLAGANQSGKQPLLTVGVGRIAPRSERCGWVNCQIRWLKRLPGMPANRHNRLDLTGSDRQLRCRDPPQSHHSSKAHAH